MAGTPLYPGVLPTLAIWPPWDPSTLAILGSLPTFLPLMNRPVLVRRVR